MPIEMSDLRVALSRVPVHTKRARRRAAVAAILDDQLDLLLIERAQIEGDPWSGHLSFPGGHMEDGDADLCAAAVRETHEEIGLDLGGAELLGELDEVGTPSPLPRLVVRPFVFRVDRVGDLSLSAREVQRVLKVPLAGLASGRGRARFELRFKGVRMPLASVDLGALGVFNPPDVKLWGMTLRMIDDLLHRLDGRGTGLMRTLP